LPDGTGFQSRRATVRPTGTHRIWVRAFSKGCRVYFIARVGMNITSEDKVVLRRSSAGTELLKEDSSQSEVSGYCSALKPVGPQSRLQVFHS
jgi:hypothetical protein